MNALTHDEMVVLAASLRVMSMADGTLSDGELERLAAFAEELGVSAPRWDAIWDEAVRTLPTPKAIAAAAALQRDEAREIVYEMLYRLATDGSIVDPEWDILEWLDEAWRASPAKR